MANCHGHFSLDRLSIQDWSFWIPASQFSHLMAANVVAQLPTSAKVTRWLSCSSDRDSRKKVKGALEQNSWYSRAWRWHGGGMAVAWRCHGGGMAVAWRWHGSGMVVAWWKKARLAIGRHRFESCYCKSMIIDEAQLNVQYG